MKFTAPFFKAFLDFNAVLQFDRKNLYPLTLKLYC